MAITTKALRAREAAAPATEAVGSTNVASVAYDAPRRVLYVRFLSGAGYAYPGTPPQRAKSFRNAASKGKFVWNVLRDYGADKKPYRKL